jgi:phage FluMu protein Com
MSLISEGMELLGLFDKAKNADLYKQLGDWIDKVRILQIENDRLLTEQRELKEQLRFKGSLERVEGHTFVKGDDEGICPRCAEVDNRPVHLMVMHNPKRPYVTATCPACKTVAQDSRPRKREEFIHRPT